MKIIKKTVFAILVALALLALVATLTGNGYLVKSIVYNFANIDDYKKFDNDTVKIAGPQPWPIAAQYNQTALPIALRESMEALQTTAFVVIKNGALYQEEYWDGYSDSSLSGSFSVAKSITSLLIGCAIKEGKIKSVDQPVGDFIPSFNQGKKAAITIRHLLTMTSGTDFEESYANPFSVTAQIYYGKKLGTTAENVGMETEPGTYHEYKSGDTQLLGMVIEKATGKKLAAYASEKLWQPMGAEKDALWSTDEAGGLAKAFCCFNTNARDFARIGQLMLDSGQWKGNTIIDSAYYAESITPCNVTDEIGKACNYYGFQWWLVPDSKGVFYARGILGQYIIVIPEHKTVIVRLGKVKSPVLSKTTPKLVFDLIDWVNSK